MKLKQAVITVILRLSKDETLEDDLLQEAKALHQELFPTLPAPNTAATLITALGQPLRTDNIPDRTWHHPEPIEQPLNPPLSKGVHEVGGINNEPEEPHTLSIPARLSLQETDLVKERAYYHQKMINATSDQERKEIRKEQVQNQKRIAEVRALIKEANQGKAVTIPKPEVDPMEEWRTIPESLYDKDQKLRKMRTNRSKKKKIMDNKPEGNPERNKAARWYELFDSCIKTLNDAKTQQIQQESASKS